MSYKLEGFCGNKRFTSWSLVGEKAERAGEALRLAARQDSSSGEEKRFLPNLLISTLCVPRGPKQRRLNLCTPSRIKLPFTPCGRTYGSVS